MGWILGTSPRLSGSGQAKVELVLASLLRRGRIGELIDASEVHEVGAHEAGEGEDAGDRLLRGVRHAQQQIGDQGDGDLGSHGILASAEEAADLQGLLDPAEEQLDLPAHLVELGDLLRRAPRGRC